MSTNPPDLPSLIVNRLFMQEFVSAHLPCCALGLVEVQNRQCAFIALRPHKAIPSHITEQGFDFGHGLIGTREFEVVQFIFDFYDFQTYNVLLNPNNPIVQSVLQAIIERGDYFFFTLNDSSGNVRVFRSELGTEILANLTDHWHERLKRQCSGLSLRTWDRNPGKSDRPLATDTTVQDD